MGVQAHEDRSALYRYRFGTAEFDEGRFELRVAGRVIEIQRRPLEVLEVILRRAGEVVTRNELERAVWRDRPRSGHVIHTALTRLRSALGDENAERIVTVARVGYRLTGSIERIAVGRHFAGSLALDEDGVVSRREDFALVSRLGQSSNHEVWLARQVKTGELRVYKFSADGEGLAALKREATFARVLRKSLGERKDLVQLLDWNFAAAPFFLEYEYGGVSLLEWATKHLAALAVEERVGLFLQVADAVAAAHSVGVLHEDLKPANLLIVERANGGWQVRLTDFGSARLLEPERLQGLGITQLDVTVTDGVLSDGLATLLYVAPEQLAGGPATVQSDVFALGILLYQLTVGDLRRPLLSGWERDVPDELLREDITAATDGNPAFRLASVRALADRLRRRAARREEQAREEAAHRAAAGTIEALKRSRARRPWVLVAFLSVALGLSSTLAFHWHASAERGRSSTTVSCGPPTRSLAAVLASGGSDQERRGGFEADRGRVLQSCRRFGADLRELRIW
jgi:eukaryotic-like serine/threonine-protein kinase